jgi:4-hydroxybenzoate polyprenyltransferase
MQAVTTWPWRAYWQLARMDKPIGTLLLLWPTLWSLWLASAGSPPLWPLLAMGLGVVLMRAAGCVINDYADRQVDGHVQRTAQRPLPAGQLTARQALVFFVLLAGLAFLLVLTLNRQTIALSVVGLLLAVIYPFMKRITHLPQLVLGLAFSWSIPMAWVAVANELTVTTWLLFGANVLWTIAYDTYYAMVDREDDRRIGVKSTAILFGQYDLLMIALLQVTTLLTLLLVGWLQQLNGLFYASVLVAAALFVYQGVSARNRDRQACFQAFLANNWVGCVIFGGILLSTALT